MHCIHISSVQFNSVYSDRYIVFTLYINNAGISKNKKRKEKKEINWFDCTVVIRA